jgi:hypothetical protein
LHLGSLGLDLRGFGMGQFLIGFFRIPLALGRLTMHLGALRALVLASHIVELGHTLVLL